LCFLSAFASSRSDLEIGVRNLDAAVADFSDNPIPRARALVARAPIQSLLQRQSEAHADIRAARAAFLAQGDIHGSATALFARGEILATHLDSGARKSAAESFLNAGAAFANAHDPARASGSLELGADILVELSSASHNQAFLGRSRKALLDAIALTEGLWGASFGIGPRLAIAEDLHRLWASLTWVLSQEDAEDSDATWCASLNAKAREILVARAEAQLDQPRSSGTAEPDELRRVVRLYDEALLKRAERVGPGENLLRESEELESASAEIEALVGSEARAWDEQRAAALANETSNWSGRNPQTVLCDFTVSEHGTVCFLWGSKVRVSDRVRTLPLRAENVRSWMNRWRAAYSDRASNEDQWEQATGALLAELGREIWTQLRDVLRDVEAVVVIPGLLSGLPVHSAMLATDGMASVGVVYSPHPSLALGSTVPIIAPLASAICVLSDPELVPTRQLRAARTEVAAVSRSLAEAGIDTLVVASVGVLAGTEVFKADGLALHPNVRCELGRPTPSWFVENWANHDLVFYSGHAETRGPFDARFVLADSSGARADLSLLSILAGPRLGRSPTFVLSACETASVSRSEVDQLTLTTVLHRLGARAVLGTQWVVGARAAELATIAFIGASLAGDAPPAALSRAINAVKSVFPLPTAWAGISLSIAT